MRQNKEWLKKSVKEGAVFVLRNQKNHINSFAIAHQMASYVLYIDYVFTDPNNRQQGYGEEMIRYLIKEHAIIEAHLLRGDLLSKKVLQKLGFKKEAQGNVWVYKNPQASNWKFI